jgi:hypothetical protein
MDALDQMIAEAYAWAARQKASGTRGVFQKKPKIPRACAKCGAPCDSTREAYRHCQRRRKFKVMVAHAGN